MQVYFRVVSNAPHVLMPDVFKRVVQQPASRFWTSAERANVVITAIEHGDDLKSMRPNKREMFMEIYNRYVERRKEYPELSRPRVIELVIEEPAPQFYMAPASARVIILKNRKLWIQRNMQRLRRS